MQITEEQQAKFTNQEARFVELEQTIATCRAFMEKHKETLAPFEWSMFGYDPSCTFYSWNQPEGYPKNIAKAFGADGWTRVHDPHTCGSVNWLKQIDGITITLKEAENIKPTLRTEVKL